VEVRAPGPGGWDRPLPRPDAVSAPFWSAAAEGRLLIQRCGACGQRQFFPRALCRACGSEPEWEEASGRGRVHTYTVVRQNHASPFRDQLPYVVAMVELEEGVRMMGNLTGVPPERVRIGMPVRCYSVLADEGVGIPMWEPDHSRPA